MLLTDYTYYQGDSAITAMYQGDVKVYPLEPPVTNNKIYYTSTDGNVVQPYNTTGFGANIVSNTYVDGQGVIEFDNSVTSIGEFAFNAKKLSSIIIPNSVTTIGQWAFNNCKSLSSVTIPGKVASISEWAFAGCEGLISVTIESGVTTIGDFTFTNCYALSSVTIPDSVTRIEDSVFATCISLSSVTIPNSVTYLGTRAFADCTSLLNIVIPDSVTGGMGVLPELAATFKNCTALSSVTIGSGVTEFFETFYNCSSLSLISYTGTMAQWAQINLRTDWNYGVPATVVHCSDGDVPI